MTLARSSYERGSPAILWDPGPSRSSTEGPIAGKFPPHKKMDGRGVLAPGRIAFSDGLLFGFLGGLLIRFPFSVGRLVSQVPETEKVFTVVLK